MARLLKDIKISEVSSVDIGAGEGVKVLLMKRDEAGGSPIRTVADLETAIRNIEKASDPAKAKAEVIARAKALNATDKLPSGWVAKNMETDMDPKELQALIAKSIADGIAAATKPLTDQIETLKRDVSVVKMSDAHKGYMSQCDEATAKAFADMNDKDRDDFMAKNPVKKSGSPVTIDDLAKRDSGVAELMKRVSDQGAIIEAMTLEKRQTEFKKMAAELGATEDGDGELMRKAYAGDAAAQTEWTKRLAQINKALTKQVETGSLFAEFGTKVAKTGNAYDQLMAKANDLREKDGKLTTAQAFAKVYTDPANRELVKAYKTESGSPVA